MINLNLALLLVFTALGIGVSHASEMKELPLKNQSIFYSAINDSQPRQNIALSFHGGLSQISPALHPAVSVLMDILEEGPKSISSEKFKKDLYTSNASLAFSAGPRANSVSITAPKEKLHQILKLAHDTWKNPKLDEKTFNHFKAVSIQSAQVDFENMRSVINYFAFRDAFQNHAEFLDGRASAKTMALVTLSQVKEVAKVLFQSNRLQAYSAGPTDPEIVKVLLNREFFPDSKISYEKAPIKRIDPEEFKQKEKKIVILNKDGATDNQILFIFPKSFGANYRERILAQVTSFLLGGNETADLFRILRSERGLTYGVYSRIDNNRNFWTVATFGGIQQTEGLLKGIPEIIASFKKRKMTSQELKDAKMILKSAMRDNLELPDDRLSYIMSLQLNDVGIDFIDQYESILESIQLQEIQSFAKQKFEENTGFLYVMGDSKHLKPILEKLGLQVSKVVDMKDLH